MELKMKMEMLKKPFPIRDFFNFMKIGLNQSNINPHKLKVWRYVVHEKLIKIFKKAIPLVMLWIYKSPLDQKESWNFFVVVLSKDQNALQQTHHEGIRIGIVVKKLGKAMN